MPSDDPPSPNPARRVVAPVESRSGTSPTVSTGAYPALSASIDARIDEFLNHEDTAPTSGQPIVPEHRGPVGLGRRGRTTRVRARKVRRVVRHIEPWSVLKLALVFYFCLWVVMLVTGTLLWRVAVSAGVINNIENFIETIFVLDNFKLNGDEIFRAYAVGGLLMVLVATVFTTLAAILFNFISDLIGGVRVTVIQEETARPDSP